MYPAVDIDPRSTPRMPAGRSEYGSEKARTSEISEYPGAFIVVLSDVDLQRTRRTLIGERLVSRA